MRRFSLTPIGPYTIGILPPLDNEHVVEIFKMINRPIENTQIVLGGRRKAMVFELCGIGPVVMKHYARGGLIRFLIKQRYIRCGATRAQMELEWLEKVRQLGIHAPEPLAFAYKGNRFYTCMLITREIKNHQTLADISLSDIARARSLFPDLIDQLALLIQNRIYHPDLHPGNVLVDTENRIWLIDFDKTGNFEGPHALLRDRYINRWRRAILRHHLPESLYRTFKDTLLEKQF